MSIKLIIADDHEIMREGIRALLEDSETDIEIIGEASSGDELLRLAERMKADVYVIDIAMPGLNGLETAEKLIRMDRRSRIIILSMYNEGNLVEKAFRYGARGYLLKEDSSQELVGAIQAVYSGQSYICPAVSGYIIQSIVWLKRKARYAFQDILSVREKQILQLIAEGFSSREMAEKLSLSALTVKTHRRNIIKKLGISKPVEIVKYAIKEGLIKI